MSSGDTEDVELNELNVPWRDTGTRRTNQRHLHEFNTCLHSFHVRLSTFPFCFYSAPVVVLVCFYSAFILLSSASITLLFCFYYASVLLLLCFCSASIMFLMCFCLLSNTLFVLLLLYFYSASTMLLFCSILGVTSASFHIII